MFLNTTYCLSMCVYESYIKIRLYDWKKRALIFSHPQHPDDVCIHTIYSHMSVFDAVNICMCVCILPPNSMFLLFLFWSVFSYHYYERTIDHWINRSCFMPGFSSGMAMTWIAEKIFRKIFFLHFRMPHFINDVYH